MKLNIKHTVFILFILIFFACVSVVVNNDPEEITESFENNILYVNEIDLKSDPFNSPISTVPSNGKPLFLGVSPNYANETNESANALRNAAEKAVQFEHVKGLSGYFKAEIGRQKYHNETFKMEFEEGKVVSMIDRLEIIKIIKDRDGTYLIAELTDAFVSYNNFTTTYSEEGPLWFYELPEVDGYIAAVGGAKRTRLLADTINEADEMALASLIATVSTRMYTGYTVLDETFKGTYDRSLSISQAEITGFNVISRWMSEDGNYIFSLAVCKSGKSFE